MKKSRRVALVAVIVAIVLMALVACLGGGDSAVGRSVPTPTPAPTVWWAPGANGLWDLILQAWGGN